MYYEYMRHLLIHKWYVFIECCRRGLIWRGLIHDWTKFLPSEFIPYARHFNGKHPPTRDMQTKNYCKPAETGDTAFDEAWRLHIKKNKHHWQWWAIPKLNGGITAAEIPKVYLIEMICDWIGAGKAQHSNGLKEWWNNNHSKLQLNKKTRKEIDEYIRKSYKG